MSRAVAWLIAAGILILGGLVVALEPSEELRQGPFVVDVSLGELGVGRNIEATVTDVSLAETVQLGAPEGWKGATEGIWVVAEVTAANKIKSTGLTSFLLIDGLEFRGSDRMNSDGLESAQLMPGIPTTGVVLFEIPRDLAERATEARLLIGLSDDWRLDSAVGTTIDLSDLDVQKTITLSPAVRQAP